MGVGSAGIGFTHCTTRAIRLGSRTLTVACHHLNTRPRSAEARHSSAPEDPSVPPTRLFGSTGARGNHHSPTGTTNCLSVTETREALGSRGVEPHVDSARRPSWMDNAPGTPSVLPHVVTHARVTHKRQQEDGRQGVHSYSSCLESIQYSTP